MALHLKKVFEIEIKATLIFNLHPKWTIFLNVNGKTQRLPGCGPPTVEHAKLKKKLKKLN
jgi:hypothetical protein